MRLLRQDRIEAVPLLLLARLQFRLVIRPLVQVVDSLPRLVRHLLAKLDHLCEDDLLFGSEQADPTDLLEIHAHRVVNARRLSDGFNNRFRRLSDFRCSHFEKCRCCRLRIKNLYAVRLDLREIASARFRNPCQFRRWINLRWCTLPRLGALRWKRQLGCNGLPC